MTLEEYEEWKAEHWRTYEKAREERDKALASSIGDYDREG